jgi:Mg-chelatase subunit ChlI
MKKDAFYNLNFKTKRCDADTNKLATYIIALLKKDLPETNLRKLCNDQLQVFLEDKTETFVDSVFKEITQNRTHLNETNEATLAIDANNLLTNTNDNQLKSTKKLRTSPDHRQRTSRHKHRRRGSYSGSSSEASHSRSRSRSKSNSSNSRSRSRSRSLNNDESSSWRGARTTSTTEEKPIGYQSQQQIPQMYQQMNNYQQNKRGKLLINLFFF